MAAAFSHQYPCSASPVTQRTEKGQGTVKPLASLHLILTPEESAFLYGLWKIPEVPMPPSKAVTIFTEEDEFE